MTEILTSWSPITIIFVFTVDINEKIRDNRIVCIFCIKRITMIEVNKIQKKYYNQSVLKDCSLMAKPGECIGIVGANGCGKTTLLSIMSGSLKASGGSIRYFGEEALGNPKVIQKYVGYVPQDNPLITELTVRDNLGLWYYGKKGDHAVQYVLQEFNLQEYERKQVSKLSGGTRRRLSLACALINMPPILIMDEPCAAVDLACKAQIHTYLQSYKSQKGTIIMSTHDESELQMCDRIYFMDKGCLRQIEKSVNLEALILQTMQK